MIQSQVLNKILQDNDISMVTLNNLGQEYFSDFVNEYDYILRFYNEYGKVPDMVTFLSKFPNFDVLEVRESNRYLLTELNNDKTTRDLAKIFNKVKDSLNQQNVEEAVNLVLKASEDFSKTAFMESVDIIRDRSRYDAYIQRSEDFSKYYVKTGFPELDEIIGGWDRQEELATIMARPNVGKSWILLKVAIAAAEQGLTVGLYSGEMSEMKVGYRMDTLFGHLSNTKIIHGNRSIQNEYKTYLDNLDKNIPGKIKVITPVMINGTAGVNSLRAFIEKEKLDILCIDQHSLLDDDRKARDPVQKASNISRDLKTLQVLKKIPIIAVSQSNRAIDEVNGMGLQNIAQSDRIGQDSTVVIGIDRKDDTLTLHLLKSRDSVNGKKLKYFIDLDKGIFNFIPNEDDANTSTDYEQVKNRYEEDQEYEYTDGGDEF